MREIPAEPASIHTFPPSPIGYLRKSFRRRGKDAESGPPPSPFGKEWFSWRNTRTSPAWER